MGNSGSKSLPELKDFLAKVWREQSLLILVVAAEKLSEVRSCVI